MLTITILGEEQWDYDTERFVYPESKVLQFEHSLVSLSKWEAKFHKLFLTPDEKSVEEMAGYIEAMLLTPGATREDLDSMSEANLLELNAYIDDPMTGTTFSNTPEAKSRTSERISSELIYFWMSQYNIDKTHENDHLNRLFTLIRIHHAKSQKPKPMSKQSRAQQMAEENARRKAKLGTSG